MADVDVSGDGFFHETIDGDLIAGGIGNGTAVLSSGAGLDVVDATGFLVVRE